MSDNIISINIYKNTLHSTRTKIKDLYIKYKNSLPEDNLFDYLDMDIDNNDTIYIENVKWHGIFSGKTLYVFLDLIQELDGLLFCEIVWESGETQYFNNFSFVSEELSSETLSNLANAINFANKNYDGHLTMMKFTTGWKICFGTPVMDASGREEVYVLPQYDSLDDALHLMFNKFKDKEKNED